MNRVAGKIIVSFVLLAMIGAVLLAYAYFIEPRRLVINRTELKVKGWDPAFDGLRVVMIGDIHGGSNNVTAEKIRDIVTRSNAEAADVVVLLGDYVSEDSNGVLKMPMREIADALKGLTARYGVFAVLGNHDGWYSDSEVAAELSRIGCKVLQNEVVVIDHGGKKLRILGLKDHMRINSWAEFSRDVKQTLAATDGQGDVVVLEHSPDILPIITGELSISPDLKLILAAHTHGGQVWFPIFGTPIVPSSYGQKYSYGHVRENNVDMFVTTGIGTSVLPIRFMMPPEIAVLTIKSQ